MINPKNFCLVLKHYGIDTTNPLSVAKGLRRMILTPQHKLKLLKDYCKETNNDFTNDLELIIAD